MEMNIVVGQNLFHLSHQKLMLLMNPKKIEEEEEDVTRMQTDVTDEEMALRYTLVTQTPASEVTSHSLYFVHF